MSYDAYCDVSSRQNISHSTQSVLFQQQYLRDFRHRKDDSYIVNLRWRILWVIKTA